MATTISVSFRDDEQELLEWVNNQCDEGRFRNRSSVVIEALKRMKDDGEDIPTFM